MNHRHVAALMLATDDPRLQGKVESATPRRRVVGGILSASKRLMRMD